MLTASSAEEGLRIAAERRPAARKVGMAMALGTRLMLLGALAWLVQLTRPILTVAGLELSWRDLILLAGGIFLLVKAINALHKKEEAAPTPPSVRPLTNTPSRLLAMLIPMAGTV